MQAKEIAARLSQRSHKVEVFTSDLYSDIPFQRLPPESSLCRGIDRHMCIQIPWRKDQGTSFTPAVLLLLARKEGPSIVHCLGLDLFTVFASLCARLRRWKMVLSPYVDPSLLSGTFTSRILKSFHGLVASTELESRRMVSLGLDESGIRVIPDGVDLRAFQDLPSRDCFRKKTGTTNHLVLYAGRVDSPTKGCDVLVEAVSLAQRRIGASTLVFAGPDWGSTESLRILSQRRGVRVIFTGNLTPADLRSALVACDVFVQPSLKEAFPLVSLEAMLCGAPVVATRVGGIPMVVRDGDTGLLVPPGDPQSLGDAICRVVEDRELSAHLVVNGKALASKYSIDRTVDELERFYTDILNR